MKRFVLSLIVSIYAITSLASVEVDGINFNVSSSTNTASVVKSDCQGNLVIPENINVNGVVYQVTEIDKSAFQDCKNLTSVKLPKSIKSIGALAFANGREIDIHIEDLSSWCSIKFGYTYSLSGGGYSYDPIAQYRLYLNKSEVATLEIPNDVSRIPTNSFSGCMSLTHLLLPDNIFSVGDYAFYKCNNLQSITFGNNVQSLGKFSFCKCVSVERLTLPQSLYKLDTGALQSMEKLVEISIPGNVQYIESGCFLGDTILSKVSFENSDKEIFIGHGRGSYDPIFQDCPLQEVYIGRNLKSKGWTSEMGYSYPLFTNQTKLSSVQIGEGVKRLDAYLFSGCTSLSSISVPNSLEEVNGNFTDCTSLPVINNIRYADKCAIGVVDSNLENYILSPETQFILDGCFANCTNMQTINLPAEIKFWGNGVFNNCSNLSTISIPRNVTKIGDRMFSNCGNLRNITIPENITSIGDYAFSYCSSLTEMIIPENNAFSIGEYAFSHCTGLTEMVIPKNVTGIHKGAFNDCTSLRNLTIKDSNEGIGLGTNGSRKPLFIDCPLEEVYLGRNIGLYEYVDENSLPFNRNQTIKKLTFGSKVSRIKERHFYLCTGLNDIFVLSEEPIAMPYYYYGDVFPFSVYSKANLHVLPNSVSLYQYADIWSHFQNIVGDVTSVENIQCTPNSVECVYDLKGIQNNKSRVRILKYENGITRKVIVK